MPTKLLEIRVRRLGFALAAVRVANALPVLHDRARLGLVNAALRLAQKRVGTGPWKPLGVVASLEDS